MYYFYYIITLFSDYRRTLFTKTPRSSLPRHSGRSFRNTSAAFESPLTYPMTEVHPGLTRVTTCLKRHPPPVSQYHLSRVVCSDHISPSVDWGASDLYRILFATSFERDLTFPELTLRTLTH